MTGPINPVLDCDFVVVGSGAAGGIAAFTLFEAGYDVIVVEEGTEIDRKISDLGPGETLSRWFREGGTQAAEGRAFLPVLQGRCLGGGTAINSAICWRLPEDVYDRVFSPVSGLVPWGALAEGYAVIERDLNVHPIEEAVLGRNNGLMRSGAQALGWKGRVIERNESGCVGSSKCMQACPADKKLSTDVTYLRQMSAGGARVLTGWEVRSVRPASPSRSASISARATREGGSRSGLLTVHARRGVVLAASAIQTPCLLRRSGLGNRHVGQHFRAHPGAAVVGVFQEPVRMWEGATQGYEVFEFRKSNRFKIESLSLPPELGAARLPGIGMSLKKQIADWGFVANWGVQVRADHEGRVTPRRVFEGAHIQYTLGADDMAIARIGLRATCELMFAAGAQAVIPAVYGLPDRLTSRDQLSLVDNASLDPQAWTMILTHLFGTCRLHPDPRLGAVGEGFQVHGAPGIHVVDALSFPSNLGVNPQHTIMALARHAARVIGGMGPG